MMTGDLAYDNLKYPYSFRIENGTEVRKTRILNHFPLLAHPLVLAFVVMVNIVMMSLLVALAIRDMESLDKTAQRRVLEDKIILINHVENSFSSKLFRISPDWVKRFLERWVLEQVEKFEMRPVVDFINKDYSIHSSLWKQSVKEFCQNEKSKREMAKRLESTIDVQKELTQIKEQFKILVELKNHVHELVQVKKPTARVTFARTSFHQVLALAKQGSGNLLSYYKIKW